jgi:hypothetical protein
MAATTERETKIELIQWLPIESPADDELSGLLHLPSALLLK